MKRAIGVPATLALALTLAVGCVTVNVYFPRAQAQRAADQIINAVTGGAGAPASKPQSTPQSPPPTPPAADARTSPEHGSLLLAATARVVDLLIPAAYAQGQPNLDISTPQIRAIIASLHQRFLRLKPYFTSGVIGLTASGTLAVRDQGSVPLSERAALAGLVAQQNRDLSLLYEQIARANGHPEWVASIRRVFAERWEAHASKNGWYYRDGSGTWSRR
jgi:uncharacterized protein YdbL (DUF1318 family)